MNDTVKEGSRRLRERGSGPFSFPLLARSNKAARTVSLIKKGMRPQGRKDSLSYKKGHEAARPVADQPTNPDLK